MVDDNILKKVVKGLGEVGAETIKESGKQAVDIVSGVITGKELVGNMDPMSDQEMAQAQAKDERQKQEEMAKMQNLAGRNVEAEIKEVVREKESEEEQKEREFLENIKRQREAEEAERQSLEEPGNDEREAKKRQFAPGPKKKSPDPSQMSATSEFKGGKID
ncbi:hypothetical protein KKD37_04400 [Patescibacteria group bacterium]|nr:hypothetical protein [Patescibacteria group bacterium]